MMTASLINSTPFITCFFVPFIGTIFGTETLTSSCLLVTICVLVLEGISAVSKGPQSAFLSAQHNEALMTFIRTVIISLLFFQPLFGSWIPAQIKNVYGYIMWSSQPLWLAGEAVAILYLVKVFTAKFLNWISFISEEENVLRVVVLFLSGICYVTSLALGIRHCVTVANYEPRSIMILLPFVVYAHWMMYEKEDGNILNAALITLSSLIMLNLELGSRHKGDDSIFDSTQIKEIRSSLNSSSGIIFIWRCLYNCVEYTMLNIKLWSYALSPTLVCLLLLRFLSVVLVTNWRGRIYGDGDEEENDSEKEGWMAFICHYILKILLMAMIGQTLVISLPLYNEEYTLPVWLLSMIYHLPGKLVQSILIQVLYIYHLSLSEDEDLEKSCWILGD